MRLLFALPAFFALASCASLDSERRVVHERHSEWRSAATSFDRMRLRDWRKAFVEGLRKARAAGHAAEIAKEGRLLDPDAAIGDVPIPNGYYRCRMIKLGGKTPGLLDYIAYPAFNCEVKAENGLQGFAKLTGSQRQVGIIFPHDDLRQVMLGTLVLGNERRAMQYGRDRDRDVAAFVEKIGPRQWRLVIPYPAFESTVNIVELVPAS